MPAATHFSLGTATLPRIEDSTTVPATRRPCRSRSQRYTPRSTWNPRLSQSVIPLSNTRLRVGPALLSNVWALVISLEVTSDGGTVPIEHVERNVERDIERPCNMRCFEFGGGTHVDNAWGSGRRQQRVQLGP